MATKRGKTMMAKALVRRTAKKAKRHIRRCDSRVAMMGADFEARRIAKAEAQIAADKLLAEEGAARAATLGAEEAA